MIAAALDILEKDWRPRSTNPKCEPQLGRRGLYSAVGGSKDGAAKSMAFLWILNLSDGRHSLLDIAERANLPFGVVAEAARLLRDNGLLAEGPSHTHSHSPEMHRDVAYRVRAASAKDASSRHETRHAL